MKTKLIDSSILATAQHADEFGGNIAESSTEYSVIGNDTDGKLLLWNESPRLVLREYKVETNAPMIRAAIDSFENKKQPLIGDRQ